MKKIEKYKYWVMLSDYDIDTASVLIEGKRWVYVAYICQQSVERQLKGMYVYHFDKEAPKTHNINFLFKKMCDDAPFAKGGKNKEFEDKRLEYEDFMVDLMFYYMSDYPFSYKNIKDRFIDEKNAVEIFDKTNECLRWLRKFQEKVGNTEILIEELTRN